jgi:hypothetical protein
MHTAANVLQSHLRGVVARCGGGLDLHDAEGVQVEDGQHHQLDQHQRACRYGDVYSGEDGLGLCRHLSNVYV